MTGDIAEAYYDYATALANVEGNNEVAGMESENPTSATTEPPYETYATGSLVYQATSYGYTGDGDCGYTGKGGLGQKMRVYVDDFNDRIVILQNSYLGRFGASQFTDNRDYIGTYIAAYQMGVRRIGWDSNVTTIDGFREQDSSSTSSTNNLWNFVTEAIYAVASYAGYSYIIDGLRAVLGGVSAKVTTSCYGTGAYLHVTMSDRNTSNFDNTPNAMGINIHVPNTGTGTYEAFSDLTYLNIFNNIAFVIRTTSATATVSVHGG